MKKLFILLLTLLLVLGCLFACANNGEDETGDTTVQTSDDAQSSADTSDTDSSDTDADSDADIVAAALSDYNIIIPNKCSSNVTNAAKMLATDIKSKTSASLIYLSDILMGEKGPVILLGDTKYPESAATKALLTEDYSFAIKMFEGGRIAICATEDGVLYEAVEYFVENYISAITKDLVKADGIDHYQQIDLDGVDNSILLSINEMTRYGVVYPSDADTMTKRLVERFASKLQAKTGASFSVYDDSKKSAASCDYEIVIGATDRPGVSLSEADVAKWVIGAQGAKIFISGYTAPILSDALNEFVTECVSVEGEFAYVNKDISMREDNEDYIRDGWNIAAPAYDGGTLSPSYNNGTGRYNGNAANESSMHVVGNTSADDFNAYLAKLETNGYELIAKNTIDDNIYAQYEKGYSLVYAYYTNCFAEARIIDDCASVSEDEFEYSYEVKEGETIDVTQYGIMSTHDGTWPSNGMFYIIKLADNSVILIDGGNSDQATNGAVDGVYEYLREITGTPEDEKIRVAALFYTHPHGDHVNMSPRLVSRYGDKIDIERLMVNFPNENVPVGDDKWSGTIVNFLGSVRSKYPDIKMIQLHRGQEIELGGATFTVMYTQEDTVIASTGTPNFQELNNYTSVIMMKANGVKTLFLGDVGNNSEREEVMDLLLTPFSEETMKCDVVQVAHHGYNRLDRVYSTIKAKYALFSTFDIEDKTKLSYNQKIIYNMLLENGLTADTIFFQGRKSWNLSMLDGKVTVTYDDIRGYDEGYLDHLASCEGNKYTTVYGKTFE